MLRQEINLYKKFAPPPTLAAILTWRRLWGIYFLMLIVFFIIYLFSLWTVHFLKNEKAELMAREVALSNNFVSLKKNYPSVFFSQDVHQYVDKLGKELASENKEIQGMAQRGAFSKKLWALSQAIEPGVWLTQIKMTHDGMEIALKGNSLGQKPLQMFFNHLSKEEPFTTATISMQKIQNVVDKDKKEPDKLTFDILIVEKNNESHTHPI